MIQAVMKIDMSQITSNRADTHPVTVTSVQNLYEFTTDNIKISNWAKSWSLKAFYAWILTMQQNLSLVNNVTV